MKPKIIAVLLVLVSGILSVMGIKAIVDWYSSTLPPVNFTEATLYQSQIGTSTGLGLVPINFFIFTAIGIFLVYMLIKSLAEELKPCVISEGK